jgi:hypothetical protein
VNDRFVWQVLSLIKIKHCFLESMDIKVMYNGCYCHADSEKVLDNDGFFVALHFGAENDRDYYDRAVRRLKK